MSIFDEILNVGDGLWEGTKLLGDATWKGGKAVFKGGLDGSAGEFNRSLEDVLQPVFGDNWVTNNPLEATGAVIAAYYGGGALMQNGGMPTDGSVVPQDAGVLSGNNYAYTPDQGMNLGIEPTHGAGGGAGGGSGGTSNMNRMMGQSMMNGQQEEEQQAPIEPVYVGAQQQDQGYQNYLDDYYKQYGWY
jgi:hypothetical protein